MPRKKPSKQALLAKANEKKKQLDDLELQKMNQYYIEELG